MTTPKQKSIIIKKHLGDIVDFIDGDRGKNYPKQSEFSDDGFCLFLNTKNVPNNSFSFDEKMFITKEKDNQLRKGKLQRGDYVLTTRGTVGNFAYYNQKVPFENVRLNSGMVILRVKSNDLNKNYLKFYLESESFKGQIKGRVSGSAQPQLPIRDMMTMIIDLPDKQTQTHIASVLSAYDDLIENNEKRIKTLEELAQRLYTEWFVKFKFPGHEKTPMVDSGTEYGMIPEGWEVKRLDDIANQNRKSVSPTSIDSQTPYVGLEHIPRKTIILSQWGQSNEVKSSKLMFRMGDILFGKIRPYFHKVVIAPINGVSSSDIIVISPKEEKYKSFILFLTSSEAFISHATKTSQGTKMPRAEWNVLKGYKIALPTNNNLILKFNSTINSIIDEMNVLMFMKRKLQFTRDLLIPQLVTGKRTLK